MISAQVVCDGINSTSNRLTTFKLRYPRIIHSEFMTHRVFSRNASGSRAVPTLKMIEEASSDDLRAEPVEWGLNQRGMQAGEEHKDVKYCKIAWKAAAEAACEQAEFMLRMGLHKQIVNRVLEPYVHINVVVSSTEWKNYFGLRLHKDADPTIQALTREMWTAYKGSTPTLFKSGEWYLPFWSDEDHMEMCTSQKYEDIYIKFKEAGHDLWETARRVSVARCARVSYQSFETGKRSGVEEDLKLYDKLVGAQPIHASPAEHQAIPDRDAYFVITPKQGRKLVSPNRHLWGNFEGWVQFRKTLPGEAEAPIPSEFL